MVAIPGTFLTMNEQPPFVLEVMAWANTLPVLGSQLSNLSSGHSVLAIRSKNGNELMVHLQRISRSDGNPLSTGNLHLEGVRQITLWEDLWHTRQRIVQSRLKALLGLSERIPARLTQVRRLDRPTTLKFLRQNHLQDAVLSKFKYGLLLPQKHFRVLKHPPQADGLLVAVATFARPRQFMRQGHPHQSYELVRFANLLDTTVVGGLDKLVSHFEREHQPDDLMTYADLEWSTGGSYQKLGFVAMGDTPPQLFWVDPVSMERYYPHRLPDGLTEQTAAERGFVPLYNAGSRKFVKTLGPLRPIEVPQRPDLP